MKKKMNLDALKVKSFVTKVEEIKEETVKGGRPAPIDIPYTKDLRWCTWYSELYTACTCNPESDLVPCEPLPEK